jgi:hypothetical protein
VFSLVDDGECAACQLMPESWHCADLSRVVSSGGSNDHCGRLGACILSVVIAGAPLSGCGTESQAGSPPGVRVGSSGPCEQHTLERWKQQLVGPGEHIKVLEKKPTRITWRVVNRRHGRGQLVYFIWDRGSRTWARPCA